MARGGDAHADATIIRMGVIHFSLDEKLLAFLTSRLPLRVFVETGSFQGDSLAVARRFFSDCRSVEMSPELFEKVKGRFASDEAVRVQLGDSPAFLASCAVELSLVPTLFWLDAHWCAADATSGAESQSPLLGELAAVRRLHPQSVLLIDDARLYLSPPPAPHRLGDWPDFHSLLPVLLGLSGSHRLALLNDVLILYPGELARAFQEFAQREAVDWAVLMSELVHRRELDQRRDAERRAREPFYKRLRRRWRGS